MMQIEQLLARFNPAMGEIDGVPPAKRHLSSLRGCFYDARAYDEALAKADPPLYTVTSVTPSSGPGDLHYGLGF